MGMVERFFSMGGYAAFVWPAYGAAALVIGGLLWHSVLGHARAKALLAQLEERGR